MQSRACISLKALLGANTDDYVSTQFHHAADSGCTCWHTESELTISGLLILTSVICYRLRWKFQPHRRWKITNIFWSSGDFTFKLSVMLGNTTTFESVNTLGPPNALTEDNCHGKTGWPMGQLQAQERTIPGSISTDLRKHNAQESS
mgnify:CR=1 FL=1